MKGDFTRSTFQPAKGYTGVRMQQGRVQLDADWNEQLDIQSHLDRTALSDLVGRHGVPRSAPGSFQVTLTGGQASVAGGRMWVGGLLCEAEQVAVDPTPTVDGTYLLYLDVWQRHVTALEDPTILESALGGADTATRTQTVCRARYQAVPAGSTAADFAEFDAPGRTTGTLAARFQPGPLEASDPCELPANAGYTGLENHLYRVEVHRSGEVLPNGSPGPGGAPTFKWSRDNGAVVTPWLASSGRDVTIPTLGQDSVRGFHDAPYFVEFSDDDLDFEARPGRLAEVIDHGEGPGGEVFLRLAPDEAEAPQPATDRHPRLRRWDSGAETVTTSGWLALEHGLQVRFAPGVYRSGDHWWIPARTFLGAFAGSVEWPQDGTGQPLSQPPAGVLRRAAPLLVVQKSGGSLVSAGSSARSECRRIFPSLTEQRTFLPAGGDGQQGLPNAILPAPLRVVVLNGQVPVAGAVVRFVAETSGGQVQNPAGGAFSTSVEIPTGADGTAGCRWQLPAVVPASGRLAVRAELLDPAGQAVQPGLGFNAQISRAPGVAYTAGPNSQLLAGAPDVQAALDQVAVHLQGQQLRYMDFISYYSGDGNDAIRTVNVPFTPKYVLCSGGAMGYLSGWYHGGASTGFAELANGIHQAAIGPAELRSSAEPYHVNYHVTSSSHLAYGFFYDKNGAYLHLGIRVHAVNGNSVQFRLYRSGSINSFEIRGYLYFFG